MRTNVLVYYTQKGFDRQYKLSWGNVVVIYSNFAPTWREVIQHRAFRNFVPSWHEVLYFFPGDLFAIPQRSTLSYMWQRKCVPI